jgi:hypothetical protein
MRRALDDFFAYLVQDIATERVEHGGGQHLDVARARLRKRGGWTGMDASGITCRSAC